ncbi:3-methyl-2-oxobutanoate hydroxymethyltransferase, partial [Xanthomonas oryzae pv. oryzae]
EQLRRDAQAVVDAGASLVVLECVPTPIATQISAELSVPTIGIGAGPGCDGQVLVMHDMLGLDSGHRRPKFVKDFLAEGGSVAGAVRAYAQAVRDGSFPDAEHAYAA